MVERQLLSFHDVAAALKCDAATVRMLVVEERSLPAVLVSQDGVRLGVFGGRKVERIGEDGSLLVLNDRHVPGDFDRAESAYVRVERDALVAFQAARHAKPTVSWPWGSYETKLLRKLAEAAERYWVRFDPSDNTTAPKNLEVSKWLQAQGVSEGMADKMATILRADQLPTGPRK